MADDTKLAPGRKIRLPDYCSPFTGKSVGGEVGCDHDYDPASQSTEPCGCCESWTCTRCGMRRIYEVYD